MEKFICAESLMENGQFDKLKAKGREKIMAGLYRD